MLKYSIIFLIASISISILVVFVDDSDNYGNNSAQCNSSSSMIFVSGGTIVLGEGALYPNEKNGIEVTVKPFFMSSHEVTNSEFQEFVDVTGYVTVAERTKKTKDYPEFPEELLVPGSIVFKPLTETFSSGKFLNWWEFKPGANWKSPLGANSTISKKGNYPVVHIAYQDALAFASWKGHRLPTESEFEFAVKQSSTTNFIFNGETHIANTWQGVFPVLDDAKDGFKGIAPVGCFKPNGKGFYDLIGNVWEWTSSPYFSDHSNSKKYMSSRGFDPNQPNVPVKVLKGGSFLCAPDYCARYRPAARQAQDTGLGTNHIGFRTVYSLK